MRNTFSLKPRLHGHLLPPFGGITLKKDVDSVRGSPKTPSPGAADLEVAAPLHLPLPMGWRTPVAKLAAPRLQDPDLRYFLFLSQKHYRLNLVFSPSLFFSTANPSAAERYHVRRVFSPGKSGALHKEPGATWAKGISVNRNSQVSIDSS
ncbi:hypothetical protein YC2023_087381 [Brassica napus]